MAYSRKIRGLLFSFIMLGERLTPLACIALAARLFSVRNVALHASSASPRRVLSPKDRRRAGGRSWPPLNRTAGNNVRCSLPLF
jgi:hypothetical protein